VNNAGILLEKNRERPTETSLEIIRGVYETNFFGVIRVTLAFLPLLKKSSNPVISNISSGLGSLTLMSDPTSPFFGQRFAGYNTSKTALNAYTVAIAHDFPEARVNAISPGYVATNINGNSGTQPIDVSAAGIIKNSILLDKTGPTGKFLDFTDERIWGW